MKPERMARALTDQCDVYDQPASQSRAANRGEVRAGLRKLELEYLGGDYCIRHVCHTGRWRAPTGARRSKSETRNAGLSGLRGSLVVRTRGARTRGLSVAESTYLLAKRALRAKYFRHETSPPFFADLSGLPRLRSG